MKEITLTDGKKTKVDDSDFEFLNQWRWNSVKIHNHWYAHRRIWFHSKRVSSLSMHRLLMGITNTKILVDHKDRDGLNNQKHNLRLCTTSENCSNKKSTIGSTSKYLGVCWVTGRGKWAATIRKNNKGKFLGHFDVEEHAALAYNEAAKKIHGEFANLNIL